VTEPADFPTDIYTEPDPSPDTLANLGPLAGLAGTWRGSRGSDTHPVVDGAETDTYEETYDLQPIDAQTNGPQLFYGLRYHQHVVKTGEVEMFHEQVGFLLWEPATGTIVMTLAIPRGQVAMATGAAPADATTFTLSARAGDPHAGILTNPFLDHAFHTPSWQITFRIGPGDTWSYEQLTELEVEGRPGIFEHRDASTLTRVAPAQPNPMAARTAGG
jgi:hypothetical protein